MKTLRDLELMVEQYFDGVGELPDAMWLHSFVSEQKEREEVRSRALEEALKYVNHNLRLMENAL